MSDLLWHELADALIELERELRVQGLWSPVSPPASSLASSMPFCVDTLAFEQWLQWIFIPRMAVIVERGAGLPGAFNILPMGEEAFAHLGSRQRPLLALLGRLDQVAGKLAGS